MVFNTSNMFQSLQNVGVMKSDEEVKREVSEMIDYRPEWIVRIVVQLTEEN